jgi:hypothetical protein
MLLPSKPAVRRAVFVIMILGSAAAVAAMWDTFAPPNACLFCTGPEQYTTALGGTSATGTSGVSDLGRAVGQRAAADTVPIPGAAMPGYVGNGASGRRDGSRSGWQPWGNGSNSRGFNSSGAGNVSVGMGGLWRLMTLAHRGHEGGGGGTSVGRTHEPRAARTHTTPGPRPARPGIPGAPSGTATPTNPFATNADSPSNPFVSPAAGSSLDPGGAGGVGHGTGGGSSPSGNPEPASFVLLGTGFLALLTELRRRRAI